MYIWYISAGAQGMVGMNLMRWHDFIFDRSVNPHRLGVALADCGDAVFLDQVSKVKDSKIAICKTDAIAADLACIELRYTVNDRIPSIPIPIPIPILSVAADPTVLLWRDRVVLCHVLRGHQLLGFPWRLGAAARRPGVHYVLRE